MGAKRGMYVNSFFNEVFSVSPGFKQSSQAQHATKEKLVAVNNE